MAPAPPDFHSLEDFKWGMWSGHDSAPAGNGWQTEGDAIRTAIRIGCGVE